MQFYGPDRAKWLGELRKRAGRGEVFSEIADGEWSHLSPEIARESSDLKPLPVTPRAQAPTAPTPPPT